jgi:hypothetical protein
MSYDKAMPEFEGTSDSLNLQAALEEAVRKAYTAYQRRTHTDPLFSYVVKRISGHLRTLTVVIETVLDESAESKTPAAPSKAPAESAPATTSDPIQALIDKQRRHEELTPNEQALIELLLKDDKKP